MIYSADRDLLVWSGVAVAAAGLGWLVVGPKVRT
jgi:hypothetical protein